MDSRQFGTKCFIVCTIWWFWFLFGWVSLNVGFHFFTQGKWNVPLPKVKAVGEDEVFKVIKTGKSKSKFKFTVQLYYFC